MVYFFFLYEKAAAVERSLMYLVRFLLPREYVRLVCSPQQSRLKHIE
jgi:hypothetical protein